MIEAIVHGKKTVDAISFVQQWKFLDLLKKIIMSHKINKFALTIKYQLDELKHVATINP